MRVSKVIGMKIDDNDEYTAEIREGKIIEISHWGDAIVRGAKECEAYVAFILEALATAEEV